MKKLFALFTSILLVFSANGQTIDIGIRGGMAIPNIVAGGGNPLSEGYKSRFAGGGGFFTEIGLNDLFSLRFGVEYTGQGGKRDGVQAMSSKQMITGIATNMGNSIDEATAAMLGQFAALMPNYFYADVKNTTRFDYLMIPLSVQVGKNLGNTPWKVYVNGGPFVSFLMSGEQISKGSSKLYLNESKTETVWGTLPVELQTNINANVPLLGNILENGTELGTNVITGDIRPVNFGVQGNVGISYQCNRNRFFVEVGGNYGFVRLQKEKANGTNRIGSGTLMVGYAFSLVK